MPRFPQLPTLLADELIGQTRGMHSTAYAVLHWYLPALLLMLVAAGLTVCLGRSRWSRASLGTGLVVAVAGMGEAGARRRDAQLRRPGPAASRMRRVTEKPKTGIGCQIWWDKRPSIRPCTRASFPSPTSTLWAVLSAVDQICKRLRTSQVLGGPIAAPTHSRLSLLLRHGHVAIERGTVLNVQPASLDITV
jgi:hypothetical protein